MRDPAFLDWLFEDSPVGRSLFCPFVWLLCREVPLEKRPDPYRYVLLFILKVHSYF